MLLLPLPLSEVVLLTPDNPGNPFNLLVFPARLDCTGLDHTGTFLQKHTAMTFCLL